MKNSALKSSVLLATLLIAGTVWTATVSAAVTKGGDFTTSANLVLQAGTGPVSPLDPTDPDNPITPLVPGTPGAGGNITVDYGSTLYFGTQTISTQAQTYYAHPDLVTDKDSNVKAVPNYAQVTDQSGELAGWTLTLTQASDLHLSTGTASDPGYALTGASISFTGGQIIGGNGMTDGTPTDVATTGTLTPGVATKLVVASSGKGAGTWLYSFGVIDAYDTTSVDTNNPTDQTKVASKSAISLAIPAGLVQKAAAYSTNLYWSLQAVPGNDWTGETTATS